ncbi:hypothetical protein SCUCBS95973_009173 [Sporothrix curviconia]|uniref:Ecp2 effector protein domain-containing protein n=1 Tax=Sporothrix curviconia TaxID=1260050 RepID=A0ABP0CVE5_9PEZI
MFSSIPQLLFYGAMLAVVHIQPANAAFRSVRNVRSVLDVDDSLADCSDTDKLICYGSPDGTSQNIDVDDLEYVASFLRQQGGLLSRPAGNDCGDWTVTQTGSVLLLSKHLNPRVNSSVAYDDIAFTLDGGSDSGANNVTDAVLKQTLLGCGTHGGQVAVIVHADNPLYATDKYKASKATPQGIILKVVKAPSS